VAADASAPTLANRFQRPSVVGAIGILVVLAAAALLLKNLTVAPSRFFEVTLIGLTTGCVYALVALGYTLVYGILQLINFAHGDVFALSGLFASTVIVSLLGLDKDSSVIVIVGGLSVALVVVMSIFAVVNAGSPEISRSTDV
jgi:branched-chain amino acid transport system permease protein